MARAGSSDYSSVRRMLYFDHNATSPLTVAAREAWIEATERFIGNPSSPHRLGARAYFFGASVSAGSDLFFSHTYSFHAPS